MASTTSSSTWAEDRQGIARSLLNRRGTKVRQGDGEEWLDHSCLFHDDAHQSASFQPETGTYYCRTEDKRYPVPDVLRQLSLPVSESNGTAAGTMKRAHRSRQGPVSPETPVAGAVNLAPIEVYEYHFPTGELSHRKFRQGDGKDKKIWQEGPDGERTLPQNVWPIYGDTGLPEGLNLLVVEGEKCADTVLVVGDSWNGAPIRAVTCGSSTDLRRGGGALAARLGSLQPRSIVLWPDHDEPGARAISEVASHLRKAGHYFRTVRPADYRLGLGGDVVDFLSGGGSLAGVWADLYGAGNRIEDLVKATLCTETGHFIFPGTRRLLKIEPNYVGPLALHQLGYVPKDAEARELTARLRLKSIEDPTRVYYRLATTPDATWWRPAMTGKAWKVDATGATTSDDPPDGVLIVPSELPEGPVDVDLSGTRRDLEEICRLFRLDETEIAMVEGWLTAAFCGLQTPIMLMRGPAGTGKTTLARIILSVIEPVCPEVDASQDHNQDPRQFLRLLQRTPVALIDNASRLSNGLEDILSKLVTGYTTGIRALYEDVTDVMRLQRAIVITTTNWDVYKGDLASRLVVVQPKTETATGWYSDRYLSERLAAFVPRIRGYLFQCAEAYYANRTAFEGGQLSFRIGDLGLIFACLGYDVDALAQQESIHKSDLLSLNDLWMECFVSLWKEQDSLMFIKTSKEIHDWMDDYGVVDVPPEKSPKLARWLEEKNPMFRDHGFMVERYRTALIRGYKFVRAGYGEPIQEEMLP